MLSVVIVTLLAEGLERCKRSSAQRTTASQTHGVSAVARYPLAPFQVLRKALQLPY